LPVDIFLIASSAQQALSTLNPLSISSICFESSKKQESPATCKTRITLVLFETAKSVASIAAAFWLSVCITIPHGWVEASWTISQL
jgi:hypothetical protein